MLKEADFISHNSRFRDLQEQLKKDERFNKVDSERERSELFEDFVMELEKAEKERLRNARHTFSKVLLVLTLYRKYSRVLTF
jgi:hypothetical protein